MLTVEVVRRYVLLLLLLLGIHLSSCVSSLPGKGDSSGVGVVGGGGSFLVPRTDLQHIHSLQSLHHPRVTATPQNVALSRRPVMKNETNKKKEEEEGYRKKDPSPVWC